MHYQQVRRCVVNRWVEEPFRVSTAHLKKPSNSTSGMAKEKLVAVAQPQVVTSMETASTPFSPNEAKKIAKLLKAADRSKRLDAIRSVAENHEYLRSGGCLIPLMESLVPKKKMEDILKTSGQVIDTVRLGRYMLAVLCSTPAAPSKNRGLADSLSTISAFPRSSLLIYLMHRGNGSYVML